MNRLNRALPWVCLVWACAIFYMAANFGGSLFPIDQQWPFYLPLVLVFVSLVGFVWCQFKIRALFDRIERREQEWEETRRKYVERTGTWTK